MAGLDDILEQDRQNSQRIERQFEVANSTIDYAHWFDEYVLPRHGSTIIETHVPTGSSGIYNNPTYGVYNQSTWGHSGEAYTAWSGLSTTTRNREFLSTGKNQIRDFLVGSASFIRPAFISMGISGDTWLVTQSGLVSWLENSNTLTTSGIGVQQFKIVGEFPQGTQRTIREIGLSGGQLYIRDIVTGSVVITTNEELRITMTGWIGS